MGNYSCTLCKTSLASCIITSSSAKQGKVLEVVKTDGKILTSVVPILVKDVLVRVSGEGWGISLSKEASSECLPLDYQLKLGKVYYVLPCPASAAESFSAKPSAISSIATARDEAGVGVKRIKIVITKQQLKELLTKQISMEEVLSGLKKSQATWSSVDRIANWKPNLESIPEELC